LADGIGGRPSNRHGGSQTNEMEDNRAIWLADNHLTEDNFYKFERPWGASDILLVHVCF
jgi:hypothetical protein